MIRIAMIDISHMSGGMPWRSISAGIPLQLTYGADIQVVPNLVQGLQGGALPNLPSPPSAGSPVPTSSGAADSKHP